ncbi:MAG: PD-(D/E)XK nuclease family transposase, partial [Alkalispirochaeta sp.]
ATVQITNPFNQKDYSEDKLSVVDVKATDVTGATYTMEVQATWHAAFSSPACCPEAPGLGPLTDFIIHFIELPQFIHRDGIPHNSSSKNLTIGSLKVYPETGTIEK